MRKTRIKKQRTPKTDESRVSEAVGYQLDEDEGWRKLTGVKKERDLPQLTQQRVQDLAYYLWSTNLLANRLIELPVAYLLAEGVSITVPDEEAQKWLNAWWRDPINDFDLKLKKKVRELLLFGEQCYPVFVNPYNGHVRLGYLDPSLIDEVVIDPDNGEQAIGLITKQDVDGNRRKYRLIVNGDERDLFSERVQQQRKEFNDGEAFYFSLNDLSTGSRGRSILAAQIDWLDAYDQFLFGELDRSRFLRSFTWDVTIRGANPDAVKARAKQLRPPAPGSLNVHNDAETWSPLAPSLGAGDTEALAKLLRNHVLGGATIPEHWFGGAADVNRATGDSMSDPTLKIYSSYQADISGMLQKMAVFQINRRVSPDGSKLAIDPHDPDPDLMPVITWPEIMAKDISRYATALQQATAAVVQAVREGLLSSEAALAVVAKIAERLGVEIDPEEELVKAKAEAETKGQEDVFQDTIQPAKAAEPGRDS